LGLTAILATGLNGITTKSRLKVKDPGRVMLTPLTPEEREKFGIQHLTPKSLQEALDAIQADERMWDVLGADLMDVYLKIKGKEHDIFSKLSVEERRAISMAVF